jgi:tRNA A37 threonylcarbamoyladenosine synthetase subunit TsaC/SUA5/YrdC
LFGVGVDAFNTAAVAQLYQVKDLSADKGIPFLLAVLADLEKVTESFSPLAQALI